MKYSLLSILVGSLLLAGCGGDGKKNTQSDTPKPVQPQPDANTAVITLGSNNNVVSLSNVAQATFSTEDAKNNPVITIQKAQDAESKLRFDTAKADLEIQNGSGYEISISSSKELNTDFVLALNVSIDLVRELNKSNAIIGYVEINEDEDGDQEGTYLPLESHFDESTQQVLIKVPTWVFTDSNGVYEAKFKIGLTTLYQPDVPTITARSILNLPQAGETATTTNGIGTQYPCPLAECIETSRVGSRVGGQSSYHGGIDLQAGMGTPVKAILSGKVSRIRPEWGLVEIVPNEKTATTKVKYLHLSKIEVKKDQLIKIGDRIGLTGNIHPTKNIEPHLHLELRKPNVKVNKEGLIYSVVDPFPYFLNNLKILNISGKATAQANDNIVLKIEGKDINGAKVDSVINNKPKHNGSDIIGNIRKVKWYSVDNNVEVKSDEEIKEEQFVNNVRDKNGNILKDAKGNILKKTYTEKEVGLEPTKRSSATMTIKNEAPATITAYWDGLESLKAEYKVSSTYIYNVSPITVNLGQVTTFSVSGVGLSDMVSFSLPNCINVTKLGGTDTRQDFSCKPTVMGKLEGVVKEGVEDFKFTVDVIDNTEMQVKLLGGSYYHTRPVCQPSDGWCQVYHAHLLNIEVSAPVYSVVFPSSQSVDLNCGGWKKIPFYAGGGCVRTENDPPTVTMSWKMLTGCGGEGCFPYPLNIYIEGYLDSMQKTFSGEYRHFNHIAGSLNAIQFSQIDSERATEYYSFF